MASRVYSVSEINKKIKRLIDSDSELGSVYVGGEVSNYKLYPSGHHYFTLKDAEGTIRCVMFKGSARSLKFKPESGMKVIAFGRITVFPRDGAYQLYVDRLVPDGAGDLNAAYEKLKARLAAEGLFDREHKKPIPRYPKRIALITSSAGAAVRDMIRILGKRYPLAAVLLMPVRVQGEEAPAEIAGAIRYANLHSVADVIITGRGGGSIEDLWAFNDEQVARAIFKSKIPVISAVGHEPDVTIADYVADLRAATPSNAAELAVPDRFELVEALMGVDLRMLKALEKKLSLYAQRVAEISRNRILANPRHYLDEKRMALQYIQDRLASAASGLVSRRRERMLRLSAFFDMTDPIKEKRERFYKLAAYLDAMSPLKVLGRGFAIAEDASGRVIKSAESLSPGDMITVKFRADSIDCRVENINGFQEDNR